MLTRIHRLAGGLSVIALAAALTACGGGGDDSPAQTINDVPAVSVSASNVAAVKPLATALATVQPTISIPTDLVADSGGTIPAGTTLKFTSTTDTSPTALAGFDLKTTTDDASGVLEAGSCRFRITLVRLGSRYTVGQIIIFNTCAFDLNTSNLVANAGQQNAPLVIRLNNLALPPVSILVTPVAQTGGQVSIGMPGGGAVPGTVNTGA